MAGKAQMEGGKREGMEAGKGGNGVIGKREDGTRKVEALPSMPRLPPSKRRFRTAQSTPV